MTTSHGRRLGRSTFFTLALFLALFTLTVSAVPRALAGVPAAAAPVASLASTLVAGDIAIVGYNADDPDEFAFVLLTNITSGTQVKFTDNGWLAAGAFRSGEGNLTWTASSDLCAGTIINPGVGTMLFSASGDQVLAYQGADTSPTFIYGLNNEGAGVWQADATNSNTSALPTGLTNGATAVALDEIDNSVYTGTTSGTKAVLLAAISNKTNWTGNDTVRQTMPTGPFTVTDAPSCGVDNPPTVSGTTPADGATNVPVSSNITVTFSEPVTVNTIDSFFDVFCEVSGVPTQQPATGSGGPTTYTIDPTADLPAGSTCTVTIYAAQVTDQDGTPNNMAANYQWSFTTAAPPTIAKIHAIQGSGNAVVPGTYTVEAIVTGDYQGATGVDDFKLDGFFIQEEDADADANAATSEGIFVYCATCPTNVVVGDKVQVTGTAAEFFTMSQLSATTAGSVVVVSSGNTLPTPATLTLPVPGVTATDLPGATAQINAYYEPFEGMLVRFPAQLSVTEYFELSRYGQVVLAQGGRFRQFTDANAPATAGYTAHLIDMARREVILDDDSNQQNHALMENPDIPVFHPVPGGFSISNYMRGGDTITDLTGVLHWSFAGLTGTDAWRIRPVMDAGNAPVYPYTFTSGNPRGAAAGVGGNVKVASFNVLNYFTTLNVRGAHSTAELDRQAAKIVAAFAGLNADVIGVMEIENNNDVAIANLVSRLNADAGADTYTYIATGTVGTDQITVGIIYKPAKVTPVGAVQTLTAAAFTDPLNTGTARNRPAVAQTFEENVWGERFTVVVNHLKSKGSCPSGSGSDADQGDGQGCWNATRAAAAAYMVGTWIPTLATGSGDPDFLIVGDLNAYRKEDPITNIKNAGYADLLDTWLGAPAYGYVFDGQLGYLDHALSSAALTSQVTGATEWHINADEVNLLDYNDTVLDPGEASFDPKPSATTLYEANAYRSSDHDPVLVGLNLLPNQSNLAGYGAAWHTGAGALRLGANWNRDGGTADNDGVTPTPFVFWQIGADGGSVDVTVNAAGFLSAWIDWNNDFDFDDAGEAVLINEPVATGPNTLLFDIPAITLPATFNARFRLYPSAQLMLAPLAPSAIGRADGGEVEDYTWSFGPNAVLLASFEATAEGNNVRAVWETAAEWNTAGFFLYRSSSPNTLGVQLNTQIIAAQGAQGQGAAYTWTDPDLAPGIYYYTLEDVDLAGNRTLHSPVSVEVGVPSAVTFGQTITASTQTAIVFLLVTGSLGAATFVLRRRR